MFNKFFAASIFFVAGSLLFSVEDSAAQVRGVFVDGFGENTKSLSNDAAIITWLNNELKAQLNLGPDDEISLSEQSVTVNNFNIRSLQQTHQGIPVVGYESRLILDAQGNQISLLGQHQGFTGQAPTTASLSSQQAVAVSTFTETFFISETPVYFVDDGELRLTWQVNGENFDGGSSVPEKLFIDAVSGEVIARYPLEYSALTREVGDMIKACRAAGVNFPLSQEDAWPIELMVEEEEYHRSEGEASEGAGHVDVLYNLLGDAYQFMQNILDMDSVDGNGLRLKAISGVRFGPEYYNECVGDNFNATWSGQYNELYIPDYALPYTEIIAHELAHGINSNGSELAYEFESGALDEGIADAIGVSFKAWRAAGGSLGQNPASIPTFANLWIIDSPIGPLRDMRSPNNIDDNPDHYDEFYDVPLGNDQGGVHSNSSIINQAFYILVEGGRHPRLGTGPNVQGIGIADASKIFALAGSQLLTPFSDFEAGRNAFALAAEILFGKFSDKWIAVHEAIDAVGIAGTWQREAPRPPPVITPTPIPQQSPQQSPQQPPAPDTSLPAPNPIPQPAPTPVPDSPAPAPTSDSDNNNALYIGLGIAFVLLALFGLSRLRPDYSTTEPEFKRASVAASPGNVAPDVSPQQIAVNRSGSIVGRLVGAGTNSSIALNDAQLGSKEGLVIGRSAALNHVVLDDSRVSRRHLRFHKEGQLVVLEDLNSTHGTMLNGNKLQPFSRTVVNQGDSIEIAGIRFTCDLSG